MESGDGKRANETSDSFLRDALGPFVHRSCAVSEEIDGDVKESGLAERDGDLFGDLGVDDPRDVGPRHLEFGRQGLKGRAGVLSTKVPPVLRVGDILRVGELRDANGLEANSNLRGF